MRRRLSLPGYCLALAALAVVGAPTSASAQEGTGPKCAPAVTTIVSGAAPSPSPGEPCWVDVQPYPFGSFTGPSGEEEAGPVEVTNPDWVASHPQCVRGGIDPVARTPIGGECYLTVTSMAFRAWNRGLAATFPEALAHVESVGRARAEANPYGVWTFDGQRWTPDLTFPGHKTCPGRTIAWAGKLDYWLVGGRPEHGWPRLCRYSGLEHEWQPFSVPAATLRHVTPPTIPPVSLASRRPPTHASATPAQTPVTNQEPEPGALTSAVCLAWNDCWFFGTYGVVVYWDGHALRDASPALAERWLHGEYIAAAAGEYPLGNPFGAVVSGTAERAAATAETQLIPPPPGGAAPPELFRSVGAEFSYGLIGGGASSVPLALPTRPQVKPESEWDEPFRTDLVGVGFDVAGHAWAAGNPAGLRAERQCEPFCPPSHRPFVTPETSQPAPLVPVSLEGGASKCTAPTGLTYTPNPAQTPTQGAYLWSSVGVLPGTGDALAAGFMRSKSGEPGEGSGQNETADAEPVIVRASCEGSAIATRFRVREEAQPKLLETVAADREGAVTAIAANAINDAWAATTFGTLLGPPGENPFVIEPPHLYRLENGTPPEAPEGNDFEERAPELEETQPIFIFEPEPEVPAPATPPPTTTTFNTKLPPAIYAVKAKLRHHGNTFMLYLSFKVRRPVTLGAEGLEHGRVVSAAHPRHFGGHTGVLVLRLDRKHWPTKVRFVA